MPTYRPDLASIPKYVAGKPISEVARELGIESIDKLASNESPFDPFPEAVEAIAQAGLTVNRYPDIAQYELTRALGRHWDVEPECVWVGAGASDILRCAALSVGGAGTSAVFADPSFVMYKIGTLVAHADPIVVPLDAHLGHNLDAMVDAITPNTTLVYVCNPNNPTGGIRSGADVRAFIDAVDPSVTIIIDEAYGEFVTDPSYASMLGLAPDLPNVLVVRTFSKIYGLAGLRVGYGIGSIDLIAKLRTTQPPFVVSAPAQAAALAVLPLKDRVSKRSQDNARGRTYLSEELARRGFRVAESQANFVYFEGVSDAEGLFDALLSRGVIVRPLGKGIRVTVGTERENEHFLAALDQVVKSHAKTE